MSSGYPCMGVPQYPCKGVPQYPCKGVPQYSYMGVRWHPCMGAQVALLALPPHSRRGCKELFVILGFIYILLRYHCPTFIIDSAICYLSRRDDFIIRLFEARTSSPDV